MASADVPRASDSPERRTGADAPLEEPVLSSAVDRPVAKLAYESVDVVLAERADADREASTERDRPDWRSAEWREAEPELRAAWRSHEARWEQADSPQAPERADRPYEATDPSMATDYYPEMPPTSTDRCLVRDRANPIPIFDGPPRREEANQGRVGDCGIVATLGAVAAHRPEAIQDAIRRTGDGRYEVTLHEIDPATPSDPAARPTGDTVTYKINDQIPVRTDRPDRPPAAMQVDSSGWAAILEKAVACQDQTWDSKQKANWDSAWTNVHKHTVDQARQAWGLGPSPNDPPTGYNRLDIGSTAYQRADLLAEVTGKDAEVRRIPSPYQGERALLDGFRDQLDAGKPVLIGTRAEQGNEVFPNDLYPGHAYEVTKVEGNKISLRNPWGRDHPSPMDAGQFWEYCRSYNHDGTRSGHYSTLR